MRKGGFMTNNRRIEKTASIKGDVYLGEGGVISYGAVVDGTEKDIHIGNGSMILENCVIKSTPDFPVEIGQNTVFGHRCKVEGAHIGDYCEIGNGVQLGENVYVGDFAILGEGTVMPPGSKVASRAVVLGNPFRVIRGLTVEDEEMILSMRPNADGKKVENKFEKVEPQAPAEVTDACIELEGKTPEVKAPQLGKRVEIVGQVTIGEGAVLEDDVKIIGDNHGPIYIGDNVHIGEGTVIHMLPNREVRIGNNVKIGKRSIIHGAKLGDEVVIEDDCIVCDDALLEDKVRVLGTSLVPQRMQIGAESVVEGYPVNLEN